MRVKKDYTKDTMFLMFMSNISIQENGCWYWTGTIRPDGYGLMPYGSILGMAHRVSFLLYNGFLPDDPDMVIDHACHDPRKCKGSEKTCLHRRCVNPEHLESVTHKHNISRGRRRSRSWPMEASKKSAEIRNARPTCAKGHTWTEENTKWKRHKDGHLFRNCKQCGRDYMQKKRFENKYGSMTP